MALLVFNLNRLSPPFDYVNESVFEIPATRGMRLANRHIRLIFILGGEARMRLGNLPPVILRAGDAVVLSQPTSYEYLPLVAGQGARLQALAVSIKPESRSPSLGRPLMNRFPVSGHYPAIQNATMLHSIHLIRTEAEAGANDSALAVSALATLLVLALVRSRDLPPANSPRIKRSSTYLVEQAREYIFKNFSEELTLEGIAWHLRLSEEYLARLFKKETGQTVFEFVREFRLNTAKRLLAGTNHSVTQIARMAGFSAPTVFCRSFRAVFGISPMAYRTAHAGNPNRGLRGAIKSI